MQTIKNQKMAGTNVQTSKVWNFPIVLIWPYSAAKPVLGLYVYAPHTYA